MTGHWLWPRQVHSICILTIIFIVHYNQESVMPAINSKWFWLTIIVIAVFMFGFRVVQINQGLPDVQISDENSDLSNTARLLTGQLPKRTLRYQ